MMTTNEMKDILANKLKDENCYFTKSYIRIKKVKDYYEVVIKDYEHIVFRISFDYDNIFYYQTWVQKYYKDDKNLLEYDGIVTMVDSKKDYDIKSALIDLGYYLFCEAPPQSRLHRVRLLSLYRVHSHAGNDS